MTATGRRTVSGPRLSVPSTGSPTAAWRWDRAVPLAPAAVIPLGMAWSSVRLFRAGSREGASVVELSEAVGIRMRGSYATHGNKEA